MLIRNININIPRGKFWILLVYLYFLFTDNLLAQEEGNQKAVQDDLVCSNCHKVGKNGAKIVTEEHLSQSIHSDLDCADCHTEIETIPHKRSQTKADCGECHEEESDLYQQHGRALVDKSDKIPTCHDCHGTHNIKENKSPESLTHVSNITKTCSKCHADDKLTKKLGIDSRNSIKNYLSSVHGNITKKDPKISITCIDCHATNNSSHTIFPVGNSRSTINFFNISQTCGKCHKKEKHEFESSIHGYNLSLGHVDAPSCTRCHGEHRIFAVEDDRSSVSKTHLVENICLPCHFTYSGSEDYQSSTQNLLIEPFHGLKSATGDCSVANCASCHNSHKILPSSDPKSSISLKNRTSTCRKCHPDISPEFAKLPIHSLSTRKQTGWPHFFEVFYIILIITVVGGMIIYCALDLLKKLRDLMRERQVQRMSINEILQHTTLAVSFSVLVITGFALRFSQTWWCKFLFGFDGGYYMRGQIHRIAGIVLLLGAVWHLIYLFTSAGRSFLYDMMPNTKDFYQLVGKIKYNLDISKEEPHMGRFSYVEKIEYWALIWGTAIMGLTGLLLWFKNQIIGFWGNEVLETCVTIHYYEAWLAFLSIIIWHTYATIFNPQVYPMNPAWITGKMPERVYQKEHALDDRSTTKQSGTSTK